jgi:hypothetical protein
VLREPACAECGTGLVPRALSYRAASVPYRPGGRSLECRAPSGGVRVEIGEYHGVVRVPLRVFQRLLPEAPTSERCVEAYYLQRIRFENIAERKLRPRQLTEGGNVEIRGRDVRRAPQSSRPSA